MLPVFSGLLGRAHTVGRATHRAFAITLLSAVILLPGSWAQGAPHSGQQQPVGLDARDGEGLTPLIVAAAAGDTDKVKSLLARGAGVNATSADGQTALIAAAINNQVDAVKMLIAAGANLNEATRFTGTALEVAERKGERQIASLLLAAGAHTSGESVGDTVCVLPWRGDGFCGTVESFSIRSVQLEVTKIVGCAKGCSAKEDCSASQTVGGSDGLQTGDQIAVPSWCLTQTGVKP